MDSSMQDNTGNCINPHDPYCAGLEIGAVSIKWVQRNGNGDDRVSVLRHEGNPAKKLEDILKSACVTDMNSVVLTGNSVNAEIACHYRPEAECIEKSLAHFKLTPDILLSLGGETFSLYTMKDGKIKSMVSSSKCAAGTGEFIMQQFQRMGFSTEQGIAACREGKPVELATRCSVYCKSDATHKLNKGECTKADVSRSLIVNLAKKVHMMIELSKWPSRNIVVAGGVSNNEPFINELSALCDHSDIIVLNESPYLEAFGAALFASEITQTEYMPQQKPMKNDMITTELLNPLSDHEEKLDYRVTDRKEQTLFPQEPHILSVDAGSTTTKAVLFNVKRRTVGAQCYLRTLGNPIQATKNCINTLLTQADNEDIHVIQAAATGSAREMVSVFLNNCLSFNEILSHARAAREEMGHVDTVFEIGGQDSKFIAFLNGIPVDYAMNEGCSAGTGSFLEESVSIDMGVQVTDISPMALSSQHPTQFGERCAAFINTDVRSALQQGFLPHDVIAGLVYSIADNYTSRIVGQRSLGDTIMFQGGVALNKAVALAMAAKTNRKIIVPPFPEMMGCIGSALTGIDKMNEGLINEKPYALRDLVKHDVEVKNTFHCKACCNSCEIQNMRVHDQLYPFGGLCSKFDGLRHQSTIKEGTDYIQVRNTLMFDEFGPKVLASPRGTIGLPMALTSFELFPFYAALINELGYTVVLSDYSKPGNAKTNAPICYPCEIAHGAVFDLINKGVDHIFVPYFIEFEAQPSFNRAYVCPSTASLPDLIRAAFTDDAHRILSPLINLSSTMIKTTENEMTALGKRLGIKKQKAIDAFRTALAHYTRFCTHYKKLGKHILDQMKNEPAVILAGRPYTTCSSDVNLALPRKIVSRGYHALPADMIPPGFENSYPDNVWGFTAQVAHAISWAKAHPNVYICLLSSFSCIPDASVLHLIRKELSGNAFCYLEMDSHTAHAGIETRIGAFLDIIEEKQRSDKKLNQRKIAC